MSVSKSKLARRLVLLLLVCSAGPVSLLQGQTVLGTTPSPTETTKVWNNPPQFGAVASHFSTSENQTLRVAVPGIDPDGDPISFAAAAPFPVAASLAVTAAISPSNQIATFSWRPLPGSAGSWPVTISLSDGRVTTSLTFEVQVMPQSSAVNVTFTTAPSPSVGDPFSLEIVAPTASGAPFLLAMGSEHSPGLPLAGVHGTSKLLLDPASLVILFNGIGAPGPFNPFTAPFILSGSVPPALIGLTFSFQAFLGLPDGFFASRVETVVF